MSEKINIDEIRRAALDRIARSQRNYKMALIMAAFTEVLFLVGFLLLADLSNRLHALLLIAAIGIYSILVLGMMALGSHVSRCTNRVLMAVELLDNQAAGNVK